MFIQPPSSTVKSIVDEFKPLSVNVVPSQLSIKETDWLLTPKRELRSFAKSTELKLSSPVGSTPLLRIPDQPYELAASPVVYGFVIG
jgi:hypothetical protein